MRVSSRLIRPDMTIAALTDRLAKPRGRKASTYLRKTVASRPYFTAHETKRQSR
jgi:hypothetical protein